MTSPMPSTRTDAGQPAQLAAEARRPASPSTAPQPLAGLRVVEFTHMVMGPSCGMILADLGAEVIKVEPLTGDNTPKMFGEQRGFRCNNGLSYESISVYKGDILCFYPQIQAY